MVMPTQETSESTRLQSPNTNDGSAEKKNDADYIIKEAKRAATTFSFNFCCYCRFFSTSLTLSHVVRHRKINNVK